MTTCELHKRIGPYRLEDMTVDALIQRVFTASARREGDALKPWDDEFNIKVKERLCEIRNKARIEEYYAIMNDDNIPMKRRLEFADNYYVKKMMESLLP